MINRTIWIAIVIVVFFMGFGASYAHFASTYDPISMKFQNQEFFNQMMSNNPKMSQQWMIENMMDSSSDSSVNSTSVFLEPLKCNADQSFVENNLSEKDFSECSLSNVLIDKTNLSSALMSNSNLTGVQIYNSDFREVDLSNSIMGVVV